MDHLNEVALQGLPADVSQSIAECRNALYRRQPVLSGALNDIGNQPIGEHVDNVMLAGEVQVERALATPAAPTMSSTDVPRAPLSPNPAMAASSNCWRAGWAVEPGRLDME
jgi:hypothetical protein